MAEQMERTAEREMAERRRTCSRWHDERTTHFEAISARVGAKGEGVAGEWAVAGWWNSFEQATISSRIPRADSEEDFSARRAKSKKRKNVAFASSHSEDREDLGRDAMSAFRDFMTGAAAVAAEGLMPVVFEYVSLKSEKPVVSVSVTHVI
tara:strand:+ start:896 stop:1348 length:453 start_codon:yes stop_codon:yes gene_type:complete